MPDGGLLSLWSVLSGGNREAAAVFSQIERRDAEALAELTVGLRMLSMLLTLSGSAMALFFLSPETELAGSPALLDDPLLRFHHLYVSHFPVVAITLLLANILLVCGLVYIQTRSGWPRDIVREFGFSDDLRKTPAAWKALFQSRLSDATRATETMEKFIFAGAALIILIIPVQVAVVAALVMIFRKALT